MTEVMVQTSNDAPQIELNTSMETMPLRERMANKKKRDEEFLKQLQAAQQAETQQTQQRSEEVVASPVNEEERPVEIQSEQTLSAPDEIEDDLDAKHIPKKRLDKEIEKRRNIEMELQKEREARIRFETELQMYSRAVENAAKVNAPREPDYDPIDEQSDARYRREFEDIRGQNKELREQWERHQQQQQFERIVNNQQAAFQQKNPDFEKAYNYVLDVEKKKAEFKGLSGMQAEQFAVSQLQPLAWDVYNNGGNVAETLYNMAKAYGYKNSESINKPNLDAVERNMPKSHSIISDARGVPSSLNSDGLPDITHMNMDSFKRDLYGQNRKIDRDKFYRLVQKSQKGSTQY